jgi:RNA polymerase sigma factor (sigma-70 family)
VDDNSVSRWITGLQEGDETSIERLWERYSNRLIGLAKHRLRDIPLRAVDEEDIAASVFESLCRGASEGRLKDLNNRDELWWLLLALTRRKIANHVRRETAEKRGGGTVKTETDLNGKNPRIVISLDELISHEPTPDFLATLEEQFNFLLSRLECGQMRDMVRMRIEGKTVKEIAEAMTVSDRTVQRKMKVALGIWAKELGLNNQ